MYGKVQVKLYCILNVALNKGEGSASNYGHLPSQKKPPIQLDRRLGGFQSQYSKSSGKERNSVPTRNCRLIIQLEASCFPKISHLMF
jgi:hypothetical protein